MLRILAKKNTILYMELFKKVPIHKNLQSLLLSGIVCRAHFISRHTCRAFKDTCIGGRKRLVTFRLIYNHSYDHYEHAAAP